jgi:ribonuclease BN (tRNA processing enzyme)
MTRSVRYAGLILSACVAAQGRPGIAAPISATATTAIVLGVGSPELTAGTSGTSIGIISGGWIYLFDAGAGVERRMFEAGKELVARGVKELGPVFITHLHVDHTIGLAALYRYHQFNPSDPSKVLTIVGNRVLTVYGPPGVRELMDHVVAAFGPDGPGTSGGPPGSTQVQTRVVSRDGGEIYQDARIRVSAFAVRHKGAGPWFGYRIQTPDRVIVISGDTRPTTTVVDACNGCDILFHEVFSVAFGPNGPVGGMAMGHTSAAELGEIARRANPKLLVLYHQVNSGSTDHDLIAEIGKSFKGKVVSSRDLDVF